ncbi:MAG: 3-hydroxyacyl-CoA dehydrogenase NAD-binding domain-containing protein [Bacteroidota bacterium]|nr:3-hydroxyacyl-CoA dehydrogenase NAD-binding domain-containing protein [Bacteroidota bacterium]
MKKIAVIGSGTMGNGIAHVFAQYGYKVSLIDLDSKALADAMATIQKNMDRQVKKGIFTEKEKEKFIGNIETYLGISDGVTDVDLAIEAATEDVATKLKLFEQLDSLCPEKTILATNTSSISITKIAGSTQRPEKVIGMHFMNPVPVMQLVEVIKGYATSQETSDFVMEIAKNLDKSPVEVNDYPGFVANRILMPMINEAIYAVYEGVGGVEEIDTVMKLGMAHPMGPLQLADFIGLDICHSILKVMLDGFGNPKFAPCPLLVNMVNAKHFGKKAGIGFYDYNGAEPVVAKGLI